MCGIMPIVWEEGMQILVTVGELKCGEITTWLKNDSLLIWEQGRLARMCMISNDDEITYFKNYLLWKILNIIQE